jgi:PhzF family phenazine biosynthesis protein
MKLFTVDAFTNTPFAGNPAGVCPLEHMIADEIMQNIAREMNLSETAFFAPIENGYHLRWFTPAKEVDLCGHATLATAHILWQEGFLAENETAIFNTLSGILKAKKLGDWIEMQFPLGEVPEKSTLNTEVLSALGIEQPLFMVEYRTDRYLIEVATNAEVKSIKPNFSTLKEMGADRIMVTAKGEGSPYDFVSRYFAPGVDIDEDPVTGSAHCYLTPYWARKTSKTDFFAHQASARGGDLKLTITDENVIIRGQAVTMLKGEMNI